MNRFLLSLLLGFFAMPVLAQGGSGIQRVAFISGNVAFPQGNLTDERPPGGGVTAGFFVGPPVAAVTASFSYERFGVRERVFRREGAERDEGLDLTVLGASFGVRSSPAAIAPLYLEFRGGIRNIAIAPGTAWQGIYSASIPGQSDIYLGGGFFAGFLFRASERVGVLFESGIESVSAEGPDWRTVPIRLGVAFSSTSLPRP